MTKRLFTAAILLLAISAFASSYYPARIDDAKAVYLTSDNFPAKADGVADDTNAIQQAINKVQETTNQGILFVPAGRYRLTKTIYIWPGIRLIGYGATRPVFVLGANTPGFQQGPTYMFFSRAIVRDRFPRPIALPGVFFRLRGRLRPTQIRAHFIRR